MDQLFKNVAKCALLAVLVAACVEVVLRMPWVGEVHGRREPKQEEILELIAARQHNQIAAQQIEAAENASAANQKSARAAAIDNRREMFELCEIIGGTPIRNQAGSVIGSVSGGTVVRYFSRVDPIQFPGDLKTYVRIARAPFTANDLGWVPVESVGCNIVGPEAPRWLPMASTEPSIAYQWYVELYPGQTSPPLPISVDREFSYEFFATGHNAQVFRQFNDGPWELLVGGQPKPQPRLRQSFTVQIRLHPAADRKERIRFALKNPQGDDQP